MTKIIKSVLLLAPYPSVGSLVVEIGRKYYANNPTFPRVKVIAIEAFGSDNFRVRCEAPHPSLGHTLTPSLDIEDLFSEET